MEKIKVEKRKLLEVLKKNRTAHRKIFEEALEGYRKHAIKVFEDNLARVRAGKKFDGWVQLTQPQDQTKDYDRVISMLEMDTEPQTFLSEQDYRAYVLDDWSWKHQFLTSNSLYSKAAMDSLEVVEEEAAGSASA